MSHHGRKSGVPDRWLDYSSVGKRLDGTRFIAFKVPLKQSLNRQLERCDMFGPWELLDALKRDEHDLGLIIDLTFTTRYYRLQDIPRSLLCVKIFTAGHDVPSDDKILSFKRTVRRFLRDNEDNDKLIGVHCTHGLNRTGYLICRYLIDVDRMNPDEAVQLFNSSRGHAIERQNYLDDLLRGPKRSNDGMEECEQEPQRGEASHQPSFTSSDNGDERRAHYDDSWYHRSFPPREPNHHLHHRPPHHAFLPPPPLRPPSPARFHQYRWTPPRPDSDWRRPHHSEEGRSRYRQPEWSSAYHRQEDRRRPSPPPPPPHRMRPPPPSPPPPHRMRPPPPSPPHRMRPYSPRWTDGGEREWAKPIRRPPGRYSDRMSGYEHF
ncbi:RNA/RNP complex-1-interacting phosphatase-like [Embiotoca jacksoni]|uniref:RNA/RNP complex-1-interacting phosphatase-like n=1 Tax=Embiotoca jacksoni TaxID=100190 RepID=UPI003703E54B